MFTTSTRLLLLVFVIECLLANPIEAKYSVKLCNQFNYCTDVNNENNVNTDVNNGKHRRLRRSVPVDRNRLFLDRNVNYLIDSVYPEEETNQIKAAIAKIEDVSCVKFTELSGPPDVNIDYIHITPMKGCFADFGRIGGRQALSLALECLSESKAIHELLHSLGMWHEHQRWDRDDYITVNFENIIPWQRKQFEKLEQNIDDTLSLPYDYNSIMHYTWREYSVDESNLHVFESKNADVSSDSIGGKEMSKLDKLRLNKLYNCDLKQCKQPSINDGTSLVSAKLDIGSVVSYKCNEDSFKLIGSRQRLCRFDGEWSGSAPTCTHHVYHFCDFQTDFCDWQDNDGWILSATMKPSEHSGPVVDHTFGTSSGHFIFANSHTKREGDKSSIRTPTFEVSSNDGQYVCVSFAYYLWGKRIGDFKVYLNRVKSSEKKLIFEKSGNLGPFWVLANYALQIETESIQFEFETVFGGNSMSDFAIDDFGLFSCSKSQIDAEKYTIVD